MQCIVIARSIGVYSELWLKRQIRNHSFFKAVYVTASDSAQGELSVPVKSLSYTTKPLTKLAVRSKLLSETFATKHHINAQLQAIPRGSTLLIHYLDFALNFMDFIRTRKGKTFVYCHGYDITWSLKSITDPSKDFFPAGYIEKVKELSGYVRFIVNSKFSRGKLLEIGIPDDRIFINYFGVDLPGEGEIGKPDDRKFTILYLGRLVDFKGPDYVIQAFEKASVMGMDAELIIAGSGPLQPYLELLKRRSRFKERIRLVGAVSETESKQLFKNADVFTTHNIRGEISEQEEAFGVSVIEAMSYGLPVVACNGGGIVDSVEPGKTGILVEPFDVENHANALLSLYRDKSLLKKMGQQARECIKTKFSVQQEHETLSRILFS
ncbi:glycosyltransferase family 4 protein [Flavihumibacter petaseus]|nr:glycosyltransferase family 4 protein [Flavihumibacter petaseus]